MLYALLPPPWLREADPDARPLQLNCTLAEAQEYNIDGYNVYYYPNGPKITPQGRFVTAQDITEFSWIFCDLDMKDYQSSDPNRRHEYATKEAFLERLLGEKILPTLIRDTGNGIHAFWRVSDLDCKSMLRLVRRLSRYFHADPEVCKIKQLMRVSNTCNTKDPENYKLCETLLDEPDLVYTCEQIDQWLPQITVEDEKYCQDHYERTMLTTPKKVIDISEMPPKFFQLCNKDQEIHTLFFGTSKHKDRSRADWLLGMLLFKNGFTIDEARTVLSHTAKASERSPTHQWAYADNIVTKIWESEQAAREEEKIVRSSPYPYTNARDVRNMKSLEGKRIFCNKILDATDGGFRRGQVLGLIGGTGNGKTSVSLNIFRWFSEYNVNDDYLHLYVSLEMRNAELDKKWSKMKSALDKLRPDIDWDATVHFLDNFDAETGESRDLDLEKIKAHVKGMEKDLGKKVGAVIIDHVGALHASKGTRDTEQDTLIQTIKKLKPFAISTDTFVIIQSQTSRDKAGIGDVELDVSAAFGSSAFEHWADHIVTIWQPLRRVYHEMPKADFLPVTAFKFCKFRDKNVLKDGAQADVAYGLYYDIETECLREMTSDEERRYPHWNARATQSRNKDRKRDPGQLAPITWTATKREKTDSKVVPDGLLIVPSSAPSGKAKEKKV